MRPEIHGSDMGFEAGGQTNDSDIRVAKSIVDYIFRWMGKKFLTVDQQEEIGILSQEVRARMAAAYANGGDASAAAAREAPTAPAEAAPPGQTALFNAWEDAVGVQPPRRPHGQDGQLLHVTPAAARQTAYPPRPSGRPSARSQT